MDWVLSKAETWFGHPKTQGGFGLAMHDSNLSEDEKLKIAEETEMMGGYDALSV